MTLQSQPRSSTLTTSSPCPPKIGESVLPQTADITSPPHPSSCQLAPDLAKVRETKPTSSFSVGVWTSHSLLSLPIKGSQVIVLRGQPGARVSGRGRRVMGAPERKPQERVKKNFVGVESEKVNFF